MKATIAFKQHGNYVYAYINNKRKRGATLSLNEFLDSDKNNRLSLVLHNSLSGVLVNEECKINDAPVIISHTFISESKRLIEIWVGINYTAAIFSGVGERTFYIDLVNYMIDTMNSAGYKKLYNRNTIWNLWGLLK